MELSGYKFVYDEYLITYGILVLQNCLYVSLPLGIVIAGRKQTKYI